MKKIFIALVILLCLGNTAFAYDVVFNANTYKYHSIRCEWARKCTKNCINIDHTEAQRRGGVPCKVCGGLEHSEIKSKDMKRNY